MKEDRHERHRCQMKRVQGVGPGWRWIWIGGDLGKVPPILVIYANKGRRESATNTTFLSYLNMDDEEDDVDFFTRKPSKTRTLSRTKSASISDANTTQKSPDGALSLGGTLKASPSKSRSPLSDEQRKRDHASISDSESDVEIVSSSEEETPDRRGPKKVKRKLLPALPRWSREKRSLSRNTAEAGNDESPGTATVKSATAKSDAKDATNGSSQRERDVSLTPPPAPSPDKLQAARALVEHVRASHRKEANSHGMRAPANGSAEGTDAFDEQGIDWDPEVAKLYRGDNAKEIRERAKREEETRRKLRLANRSRNTQLQSASDPSGSVAGGSNVGARGLIFSRTMSVPNPVPSTSVFGGGERASAPITHDDGEDSDDSIQLVSGASTHKSLRVGDGSNASAAIALSDSDDDGGSAEDATHFHTPPGSPPSTDAATEDQGEVMSLTLSSSLGSTAVSVRPTAQLSKIIAHFVATFRSESRPVKQRLPDSVDVSRIKIRFDGVIFEPNPKPKPRSKAPTQGVVSDLDVEDGDQIEIVW